MNGFMWECSCGHVIMDDMAPEECPSCYSLNSFLQLPEEIVAEREKDMTEQLLKSQMELESPKRTLNTPKAPKRKTPAKKKRSKR